MINSTNKIVLIVFAIFSFVLPLSIVALFNLDEGAFSEATREMLSSGNFLTTYLNGELRFDKPILIYWFQTFSVSIFGLNEFALRLPSAIAGIVWAYVIYKFTKHYYDEEKAFVASLFFLSSLQISIIAKAAIADSLLNLFITSSMFLIYTHIKTGDKKPLYFAFALIALGVLTKGPVAIMIPIVVSFLFLAYKKNLKMWLSMVFNPIGIIIFLAIALPWYILEYIDQGQKFIDGFFLKHNLSRFNSSMEGHSGGILYYIPVVLLGFAPFTSFFLNVCLKIKKLFSSDLETFLIIWFLFVFIFFSFSNTKLPHYIIYGYSPMFILMAVMYKDIKSKFWLILPFLLLVILFLFLPNLISAYEYSIKDKYFISLLPTIYENFGLRYQLSLVVCLIVVLVGVFIIKNERLLALTGAIFLIVINFIVVPAVAKVEQEPLKNGGFLAKKQQLSVTMYKMNYPTFNVYAEQIVNKMAPKVGDVVVTKCIYNEDFENYELLFKESGICLIRIKE